MCNTLRTISKQAWPMLVIAVLSTPSLAADQDAIQAVYLTWNGDPRTSMTVNWITPLSQVHTEPLRYRRIGQTQWRQAFGRYQFFPSTDLTDKPICAIHSVELTGLPAGRVYEFRCGADGPVMKFRTMPDEFNRPIRFAVLGQVYGSEKWPAMCEDIARRDADFVLLGGNIAGAKGDVDRAGLWVKFFKNWSRQAVAPDGRLIPMIPVIGNEEVRDGGFNRHADDAPLFDELFDDPDRLFDHPIRKHYGAIDFSDYLSIITLNSGHTQPIAGEQADWLEHALASRINQSHVIVAYHTPAYPAIRPFNLGMGMRIRQHWTPLFKKYKVTAVFENHENCYKRTLPMTGDQPSEQGVVYFGSGCTNDIKEPLPDSPDERRYLAHSQRIDHFQMITLDGSTFTQQAIDADHMNEPDGQAVFDSVQYEKGQPKQFTPPTELSWLNQRWVIGLSVWVLVIIACVSACRWFRRKWPPASAKASQ